MYKRVGAYDLATPLGSGAFATVYRAIHRTQKKVVAVKAVVRARLGRCPRREVRICLTTTVLATRVVFLASCSSAAAASSSVALSPFDSTESPSTDSFASASFSSPPFSSDARPSPAVAPPSVAPSLAMALASAAPDESALRAPG